CDRAVEKVIEDALYLGGEGRAVRVNFGHVFGHAPPSIEMIRRWKHGQLEWIGARPSADPYTPIGRIPAGVRSVGSFYPVRPRWVVPPARRGAPWTDTPGSRKSSPPVTC